MLYDLQQRIFFVKTYYESKSILAVQRSFVNKYNVKSAPGFTGLNSFPNPQISTIT